VTGPPCRGLFAKACGGVSKTDAVDNVLAKVDNCSMELAAWNRNSFGHVGREISKLEDSQKYLTDVMNKHEVLNKIKEWRCKEEIMWWQRARIDFLKYGDSNTRRFRSRANMRWTKNVISKLQDADGVVYTDPDKLEHIVVDYLSQLFTGASTLVVDPGLEGVFNAMKDYLCAPYTKREVEKALAQMNPHQALGPDKLNTFFFQKH